jgi:CheY-like chemotaxis protein
MSGDERPSVVVVDDDEDIREVLVDLIRDEGWTAVGAENGKVALERLQQGEKACLILLDLMMPVMNGWQFCEASREDDRLKRIPVVVITASGLSDVPGASAVLQKPLAVEDVLSAVERVCGPPQPSS